MRRDQSPAKPIDSATVLKRVKSLVLQVGFTNPGLLGEVASYRTVISYIAMIEHSSDILNLSSGEFLINLMFESHSAFQQCRICSPVATLENFLISFTKDRSFPLAADRERALSLFSIALVGRRIIRTTKAFVA